MALLEIVTYPNPVLETPGEPVTVFDAELKKLVADMFETMDAASGVGLAAPQVGVSQRLFVMDCSGGRDPKQRVALINPETEHRHTKRLTRMTALFAWARRPRAVLARRHRSDGAAAGIVASPADVETGALV